LDEILENLYKRGSGGLQLFEVVQRKRLENLFAVVGELDQDLAPITGGAQAAKETSVD
jgi:hypothetical protein